MGPPPDTDTMLSMLENPQFQSIINEALQNPATIDIMIQQNPVLRDMGPGVRQMMQSPEFRRMMTDPNSLRQMAQMQRAMGGGGGLGGGGGAFPAPGVTNTTPEENREGQNTQGDSGAAPGPGFNPFMQPALGAGNPFSALFGGNQNVGGNSAGTVPSATQGESGQGAGGTDSGDTAGQGPAQPNAQNPFGFLMNPGMFGGQQGGQGGMNPFNPQQNPFLRDPALLSQVMQGMGGGQQGEGGGNPLASLLGGGQQGEGGANPLASLLGGGGGFGAPAPQDNRPPEERYAEQLRQLNDMGFFEFERNIEALRRTGGSVQGAVEYLLGGT